MADSICQKAGDQTTDAVARKPDSSPRGYFISGPPARRDEHECWRDAGLSHTEEKTNSYEAAIIGAAILGRQSMLFQVILFGECYSRSGKGNDSTPKERVDNEILGDRQAGYKQGCWIFPEEIAKIKHLLDKSAMHSTN